MSIINLIVAQEQSIIELQATVAALISEVADLKDCIVCMGIAGYSLAESQRMVTAELMAIKEGVVPTTVEAPPTVASDGYLDVASYIRSRLGHDDLRLASQFGRMCAQAGRTRGIEPEKVTQPGAHWRLVNAWPIEFLREMWHLSFGGVTR